jgi:A/G-specific adenine glycosylase
MGNKILMQPRNGKDIWNGLYQFPLSESLTPPSGSDKNIPSLRHILTHQVIEARFEKIQVSTERELLQLATSLDCQAYNHEEIERLPKPILIDNYLNQHFF